MTHTLDRRHLLALAASAVVPTQSQRQDDAASSIRTLLTRLRGLYETRDVAALHTVVTRDVVFEDPTFRFEAKGAEALAAMFAEHAKGIVDLQVAVEREVILPPWAIVQQTQTFSLATPGGPRIAAVRGVSLYRIERGLVAEWWDYYDAAGFQKQVSGGAR